MRFRLANLTHRAIPVLSALFTTWLLPALALAAEEEKDIGDARLQNYPQDVILKSGGSVGTWFVMILLAALAIGVMFKNANRSHLD